MGTLLVGLTREWRYPRRSLPKLGFYLLIGMHTMVVYFLPSVMGLFFFSYIFHHWMVAVGLFNRITFASYAGQPSPMTRYVTRAGPFLVACVLWYLFFDPLDKAGSLTPVPDAMAFYGASVAAKVMCGLVIGIFFAFNYLHYYYDRVLYNFGNPAVRRNVGPLIFGPSDARPGQ